MEGYLIDANHIIPLLRGHDPQRTAILEQMKKVRTDSPVYIATATLAELEVGCCLGPLDRSEAQADIRQTIQDNDLIVLEFTKHTAAEYGSLKAALMRKYNREGIKNAAKWPERWPLPDTGAILGVDEFDLLVVSHAIERRLVIVTTETMSRIVDGLDDESKDLQFKDWITTPTAS